MNPFVHPVHLENDHVELRQLTMDDADDLREATRDGDLHTLWFTAIPNADGMATEIERRLALQRQGLMNPFAVINKQPRFWKQRKTSAAAFPSQPPSSTVRAKRISQRC